jgi:hypothetical protein
MMIASRADLEARATRRGVYAQPASRSDIAALHAMLAARIDRPIASAEAAARVQEASPHSIWSLHSQARILGGVAFLPLNALGLYELVYGKLDRADPPLASLAIGLERPAILYVWAVVAQGSGVLGFGAVLRQLDTQRFGRVDLWAEPATAEGGRLADRFGFSRIAHGAHGLRKLERSGR